MASVGLVEKYIQLGIMETITSKVMVAWVKKIERNKLVFGIKVLNESKTNIISWITVGIASYIDWTGMTKGNFIQENIQK